MAQLVGGLEPARTIMLQLLASGKDVVTANKALLAEHGPELFDAARRADRSIAFEAAVAGGIPIIANINQCLSANQILSIHGILNGTSNFILTQMEDRGASYAAALAEAQRRGYAEADPTMDVDGTDTAQKLAILAHLAFGVRPQWREHSLSRHRQLDVADLRYATRAGLSDQAAGRGRSWARRAWNCTSRRRWSHAARRWPKCAERTTRSLWWATPSGQLFFHGLGAGQMPTASAVVADLIDTVVGRAAITFRTLRLWSEEPSQVAAGRSGAIERPLLFAIQRGRPAGRAGRDRRRAGPARDFDRLGHPAHARRHRRHRAAGDHDPRRHRRRDARAFDAIDRMQHVRAPSSRMRVYG